MGRSHPGRVRVEVDRDLLREAQRALGARTPAETVRAALAEAVRERRPPAALPPGPSSIPAEWLAALLRARPQKPGG